MSPDSYESGQRLEAGSALDQPLGPIIAVGGGPRTASTTLAHFQWCSSMDVCPVDHSLLRYEYRVCSAETPESRRSVRAARTAAGRFTLSQQEQRRRVQLQGPSRWKRKPEAVPPPVSCRRGRAARRAKMANASMDYGVV